MENIILPSPEMVKDYMEYGYLDSILVGLKISLTLLPIAIIAILTTVTIYWINIKISKKKK